MRKHDGDVDVGAKYGERLCRADLLNGTYEQRCMLNLPASSIPNQDGVLYTMWSFQEQATAFSCVLNPKPGRGSVHDAVVPRASYRFVYHGEQLHRP
jgi:hypothetical protein